MHTGVIMGIEIERGVPVPRVNVQRKYPHDDMAVGDSFYLEGVGMKIVLNSNWRAQKRLGWRFTARKEGEGIRVWRVM